ncbi:uncharacterized protein N7473_012096 [Penicillium subrubescens]|uniref:Alb1-domain-containing protein n=1 Tax=Penicillium subrubescens TaxID=1316194 RepID=A0A1Q5UJG6_9EURO|nr:uncharacterized protein N7473_012096 [Penicillium subrubescens]KAJ5881043.1 hypothetical protein N7473_012096 [Penicillium subrubescens]OKP12579.1 hypothetical protein PENSUB_1672 [Penicillium subrubescens]
MAKNKPRANTRAARRGAEPSLNLDKSLTSLPRAESTTVQRPSLLVDRATAGVQKKRKDGKRMTKAQRLRQQKGMDRAEAVMDQLEIKKAKSLTRAKFIKERRADWEEMNKKSSAFAALQQTEDVEEDDEEDNDDDDAMATENIEPSAPLMASIFAPKSTNATSNPVAAESAPTDEYDEIT